MTRTVTRRSRAGAALLAGLLALLPGACSSTSVPELPEEPGVAVSGKVTYQGQAVPYGVVLFYPLSQAKGRDSKQLVPAGVGMISADGTYQVAGVPPGPVTVCVACDPESPLMSYVAPARFGVPKGGDPGRKAGPQPGGPPQPGDPPPGGPPKGGGKPPRPKDLKAPPRHPGPGAQALTSEQKQTLRAIHEKYGSPNTPRLNYFVKPREAAVIYNIELK